MSPRRGTVRFLDDILDDASDYMHSVMQRNDEKYGEIEEPEKTAETLAVSAIMVRDMYAKRANPYPFNLERMTSLQGDTGPYLQYAHARLCSLERKAGLWGQDLTAARLGLLTEAPAVTLIRLMARYPDAVKKALQTLEATTILTCLFRVAQELSTSYEVLRVVDAPEGKEVSLARAALYRAARQVLRNGMILLGMTPLER
jgi:arginyl-tRNA synthetase